MLTSNTLKELVKSNMVPIGLIIFLAGGVVIWRLAFSEYTYQSFTISDNEEIRIVALPAGDSRVDYSLFFKLFKNGYEVKSFFFYVLSGPSKDYPIYEGHFTPDGELWFMTGKDDRFIMYIYDRKTGQIFPHTGGSNKASEEEEALYLKRINEHFVGNPFYNTLPKAKE